MRQNEAIQRAIRYVSNGKGDSQTERLERAKRVLARHRFHLIKTHRLFVLPLF